MIKRIYNKEYSKDEYYKYKIQYYKRKIEKTDYIFQQSRISSRIYFPLLKRIYNRSGYNWSLVSNQFRHEDYVWWSYVNYQENRKLRRFIDILEMELACDRGCPHNIISIVELINMNCYFNRRIRYFFTLMSWAHNIFIYYNRFYRYHKNNKLFGKIEHLNVKNGHKLHFIAYMYHRQYTGARLNKNHLRY